MVVCAKVEYHPVYGLSLSISEIDPVFTIGQRELEKQRTIKVLAESGHLQMQSQLSLPYLPSSVAVISSRTAAGYGDFMKHLQSNGRGYKFNCTLFHSLMQGDNAPSSIIGALDAACEEPDRYNLIVIMRGGGAEGDMFCFDDYSLCKAIAELFLRQRIVKLCERSEPMQSSHSCLHSLLWFIKTGELDKIANSDLLTLFIV